MAAFILTGVPAWILVPVLMPLTAALFAWITLRLRPQMGSKFTEPHNDVVGYAVTAAGIVYAVVVAFVLFAVWDRYEAAQDIASKEASSVVALYRDSAALDPLVTGEVRRDLVAYANNVIDDEWPAMQRGDDPDSSRAVIDVIYADLAQAKPATPSQQALYDAAFVKLNELDEQRTQRHDAARGSLPSIFWWVLIGSDFIVLLLMAMLHLEDVRVHLASVVCVALVTGAMLYLIIALDFPFVGAVHTDPTAMQHALAVIDK